MSRENSEETPRRAKGGGAIFQDKNGIWYFRMEIGPDPKTGKRQPPIQSTGRNKSLARERFVKKIADYERTGKIRSKNSPYLRDWLDRWLEEWKRPNLKPRTYETYKSDVKGISEIIGGVRLNKLDPACIRRLERSITATRASKTAFNYYQRLKNALRDAVTEGLIDSNPCDRVPPPRVEANPTDILNPGQQNLMIEAENKTHYDKNDPNAKRMWELMWRVAFGTGMRQAERFAIMPFQLQDRNGVKGIWVCQSLQRYKIGTEIPKWLKAQHIEGGWWLVPPKSRKGNRFVPISGALWDGLHQWIIDNDIHTHDLVFTRAGHPLANPVERRRWEAALNEAGLPYVTIRSARHFFATQLATMGVSDDARRALMGHVSIDTTAGYTHWSPQMLGRIIGDIPELEATA